MKRSLENGDQPPSKKCNEVIEGATSTENQYRERLLEMCKTVPDTSNSARDVRICTILRCMQWAVDQTSYWCGLPQELIQYIYELGNYVRLKPAHIVSHHDMFYRLNGRQQISFFDGTRTLSGERGFETQILDKFFQSSTNESFRAEIHHAGLKIASLFLHNTRSEKYGFKFLKSEYGDEYYFIRYYFYTVNSEGLKTKECIDSGFCKIPPGSQYDYDSNSVMLESYPKLAFAAGTANWFYALRDEYMRIFDLVINLFRETFSSV
jgi:hypothetical protein